MVLYHADLAKLGARASVRDIYVRTMPLGGIKNELIKEYEIATDRFVDETVKLITLWFARACTDPPAAIDTVSPYQAGYGGPGTSRLTKRLVGDELLNATIGGFVFDQDESFIGRDTGIITANADLEENINFVNMVVSGFTVDRDPGNVFADPFWPEFLNLITRKVVPYCFHSFKQAAGYDRRRSVTKAVVDRAFLPRDFGPRMYVNGTVENFFTVDPLYRVRARGQTTDVQDNIWNPKIQTRYEDYQRIGSDGGGGLVPLAADIDFTPSILVAERAVRVRRDDRLLNDFTFYRHVAARRAVSNSVRDRNNLGQVVVDSEPIELTLVYDNLGRRLPESTSYREMSLVFFTRDTPFRTTEILVPRYRERFSSYSNLITQAFGRVLVDGGVATGLGTFGGKRRDVKDDHGKEPEYSRARNLLRYGRNVREKAVYLMLEILFGADALDGTHPRKRKYEALFDDAFEFAAVVDNVLTLYIALSPAEMEEFGDAFENGGEERLGYQDSGDFTQRKVIRKTLTRLRVILASPLVFSELMYKQAMVLSDFFVPQVEDVISSKQVKLMQSSIKRQVQIAERAIQDDERDRVGPGYYEDTEGTYDVANEGIAAANEQEVFRQLNDAEKELAMMFVNKAKLMPWTVVRMIVNIHNNHMVGRSGVGLKYTENYLKRYQNNRGVSVSSPKFSRNRMTDDRRAEDKNSPYIVPGLGEPLNDRQLLMKAVEALQQINIDDNS
jgi:hypothetical protein